MEQKHGEWFEKNQERLQEVSKMDIRMARKCLREYVIRKLRNNTLYGAHTVEWLGEEPIEYYSQTAWQKLCNGDWQWKENRSLIGQLCRIASCLIQMEVKKYKRAEARGETDVIHDFDMMFQVPDTMEADLDRKEEGFVMIMEAVQGKPELVAYVEAAFDGAANNEDIAEKLNMDVEEVLRIERRVLYKIKKYRDEQAL